MHTVKISKINNKVTATSPLRFEKIVTSGDGLCLIADKEDVSDLLVGGLLHFEKTASGNSGEMLKVCETDVKINDIVTEGTKTYVYFDYVYIEPLTISSFLKISSPDGYKYKFYFEEETNMVPGNFECRGNYVLYAKRPDGSIMQYGGLGLCYPNELVKGKDISSPISGWCSPAIVKLFNYETMERNSILATTEKIVSKKFVPSPGDKVLLATNPYFFIKEDGECVLYGSCNDGLVNVCEYTDYLRLEVKMDQDYDAKRLLQEYQVNELFVKKIKNSIIPDFVDLEKVKYAPAFYDVKLNEETEDTGDTITTMYLATGLTFNLHFRSRVMEENLDEETPFVFEDTWHLTDITDTWNANDAGNDGVLRTRKQEDFYTEENEDFLNSSNLMGYLGFTDDDIYNQKNRVKQSFIRLSFYDSKDPLTQNLLYYSTIFFDSGELFGRFVKKKAELMEKAIEDDEEWDEILKPVVWNPIKKDDEISGVTCQLTVNDEYDMTKSGEGFNLYLFREDAPVENMPQDIYMKVEFNHAGVGRTIPLIVWPKKNEDETLDLTIQNYLDCLYIKVRIELTDRGYVYTFPFSSGITFETNEEGEAISATTWSGAVSFEDEEHGKRRNGIVWENERLVFNLFEPMIKAPEIENNG